MENLNSISTFNPKQRDAFIKLLSQAQTRAEKEMESDWSLDSRVEKDVVQKLAEADEAGDALKKVRSLCKELEEAKTALRVFGFDCDEDGDVSLNHDTASKALRKAVADAQRSAKQERNKGLRKYDLAMVAVLASEDVQEAKKIVEGLLN